MGDRTYISPSFCIYLSLMLLLLPLQWLVAITVAAAFHEVCHWMAIRLLGKQRVRLGLFACGARMTLPSMSRGAELICALAGPVGSISLLLVAGFFPRIAVCGLVQGLNNLIPIYPLDGGRILHCLAQLLFAPPKAKKIVNFLEKTVCIIILVTAIWLLFIPGWTNMPLLIALPLLLRRKNGNIACKPKHLRVQ